MTPTQLHELSELVRKGRQLECKIESLDSFLDKLLNARCPEVSIYLCDSSVTNASISFMLPKDELEDLYPLVKRHRDKLRKELEELNPN